MKIILDKRGEPVASHGFLVQIRKGDGSGWTDYARGHQAEVTAFMETRKHEVGKWRVVDWIYKEELDLTPSPTSEVTS